jgi:hypothetical protein
MFDKIYHAIMLRYFPHSPVTAMARYMILKAICAPHAGDTTSKLPRASFPIWDRQKGADGIVRKS